MAEKQFDFSIIMEDESPSSSVPKDVWGAIPIKEDKKGPKTIAMVLFFGAILILFQSYQDFLLHSSEDISDEEVETLLETPNSQSDVQITEEQYQQFHDDARDSNGFIIRAIGLGIAGVLVLVGSINTFRLKQTGPVISTTGATIGLISGVYGSQLIRLASDENLSGALLLTYEIFVYLCGVCMFVCGAFAALPMINARARKAMKGNFWSNVELVNPNEVNESEE